MVIMATIISFITTNEVDSTYEKDKKNIFAGALPSGHSLLFSKFEILNGPFLDGRTDGRFLLSVIGRTVGRSVSKRKFTTKLAR